jgi:putative ABC transport system ATP-binding protein
MNEHDEVAYQGAGSDLLIREKAIPRQSAVVEMVGVSRSFPGPPEVLAVREVDLTIDEGDYVSIVGPSGSGKSTLLHLLGLLDRPSSGIYRLDGVDVSTLTERERASLRGERIGFVFQAFHLLAHRTVLENVTLSMLYSRVGRKERLTRARTALERVGLGHRMEFEPTTLSGGERQRVAIARALVSRPSLLLADEPTGNLDSQNAEAILAVFDELHRDGITIAVITHDIGVSNHARRRVRIVDGKLTEAGGGTGR